MDFKEIENVARKNEKVPASLNLLEMACYVSLRALYNDFRNQHITAESAAIDKKHIKLAYANMIKDFIYEKSQYEDVIKKIRLTDDMRVKLRKCEPDDRLAVALELIGLYSGENFMDLAGDKK